MFSMPARGSQLMLTIGAVGFALAAMPAGASAVSVSATGSTVNIVGGPEANHVGVEERPGDPRPLYVTDTAGVSAGAGCNALSPTEAECGDPSTSNAMSNLGDGNDSFKKSYYNDFNQVRTFVVNGEGGDDELSIVNELTASFTLNGGPGNDTINGAGRNDVLNGGDGNDTIGGQNGDDAIEGGAGADKIYGDNGDDAIDGGSGDDTIDGANGSDTIDGGAGQDVISGDGNIENTGNDRISAADGERDTVQCGFGSDTVEADKIDAIEGNGECEQVTFSSPSGGKFPPPKLTASSPQKAANAKGVEVFVSCPSACYLGAYMSVKVGSAKPFEIDGDIYRLKKAGKKRIVLKLSSKKVAAIKTALKNHKKVVATVYGVRASNLDDDDEVESKSKKVTITG
jgi:hemolysin type calcium-binding protein